MLALSENEATRQYAPEFRQSEGYAAFALREVAYRRLLGKLWLGISLMKEADLIQGDRKFLAAREYKVALDTVRRTAGLEDIPIPDLT